MLLDDPIFQDDLQRAPMLLALSNKRPEHYALVEYSLKLAQEQHAEPGAVPRICAWLFSYATLERLRSAMLARLNVRYASGDAVLLALFRPSRHAASGETVSAIYCRRAGAQQF